MVYTTAAKVAAFMALPAFSSNTIPTDTEVADMIVLTDRRIDNLKVETTTVEKELLSTLAVAQILAKAPGLFQKEGKEDLADRYRQDYMDVVEEIRAKVQADTGTSSAYGRVRKVN